MIFTTSSLSVSKIEYEQKKHRSNTVFFVTQNPQFNT